MFHEMKAACLLQNSVRRDAAALTAETALEMATIRGATAIGRAHDLGSLEAGKRADIVLLDLRRPNMVPTHDLVSNLVFSCNGSNVHTVFVDGTKVVENGQVLGMDEGKILAAAQPRAELIRKQLNLSVRQEWPVVRTEISEDQA